MDNQNTLDFWNLYDQYMEIYDKKLFFELSRLLSLIENKNRVAQISRLAKDWDRILAWQVLRDQNFIFSNNDQFQIEEGEIIIWEKDWDRLVFLSRVPVLQIISNERFILIPGVDFSNHNSNNTNEIELKKLMEETGLANQKGLYLPIFEEKTVYDLINQRFAESRNQTVKMFKEKILQIN